MKCHEVVWENSPTSDTTAIRSFHEFWPFYVRQHSRPRTRLLHATGSVAAVIVFGAAFAVNLWLLLAVPVVGYAFAWYAHFFVEHNRPATFGHPFYSLVADFRMLFLMMAGRMDNEVAKHIPASGAPGPVSHAGSPAA
ncbi:MAG: Mpo1-like protein [Thermoanaerobaculia bacterium]